MRARLQHLSTTSPSTLLHSRCPSLAHRLRAGLARRGVCRAQAPTAEAASAALGPGVIKLAGGTIGEGALHALGAAQEGPAGDATRASRWVVCSAVDARLLDVGALAHRVWARAHEGVAGQAPAASAFGRVGACHHPSGAVVQLALQRRCGGGRGADRGGSRHLRLHGVMGRRALHQLQRTFSHDHAPVAGSVFTQYPGRHSAQG